jgi:hypothetical protein
MTPRWYDLISRAIEEGAQHGLRRFIKHRDDGAVIAENAAEIAEVIGESVMLELGNIIFWNDGGD